MPGVNKRQQPHPWLEMTKYWLSTGLPALLKSMGVAVWQIRVQITALPLTVFDSDLSMPQLPYLKHGFHHDNYHMDPSVLTFSCIKKGESKGILLSPLQLTH